MIRLCARWLYWRYRVYRAEHRPSGALGSALARFWCTLWLHPGDWFGWLKPLGKALAASPVTPIGALSGLGAYEAHLSRIQYERVRAVDPVLGRWFREGLQQSAMNSATLGGVAYSGSATPLAMGGVLSQLQAAQLGSLSYTPWPGLQQALANVQPGARGYSSQSSLLALLNASNPYGR